MAHVATLIDLIQKGKGAKFASFKYRAKGTGELSKIVVILGAKTENLYKKDIEILTEMIPNLSGLAQEAAMKILKSRNESLLKGIGNNDAYTHKDTYVYPVGLEGIRVHKETGEVYVNGLVEHKEVIEPGEYKEVKSRPLTIEKKKIEKELPSGRYRMYVLRNIKRAALNGEVLEIELDEQ